MSSFLGVKEFAAFFIGGAANLAANKEKINALNVFPVPDGDTGTNMGLTMSSAVKDVPAATTISGVGAALAHGALLGARGNSGVILSQILRGFSQGVEGAEAVAAADFSRAMQKGVELAYKSVMRPVEGTILTVSRKMAEAADKAVAASDDMTVDALLELMLEAGYKALNDTPNQLAILKEAGVVDSGAAGLIAIFAGGLRAVRGEEFEMELPVSGRVEAAAPAADDKADLVNHYCTEFFIHGENIDVDAYRAKIQGMGESQVVVGNETVVKTHIHTADPGAVLSYALTLGSLHDLKIDNMKDQHRETIFTEAEKAAAAAEAAMPAPAEAAAPADEALPLCGVVAVSSGAGLDQIFTEMGAGGIVSGGQSMNPSAEDILTVVEQTAAQQVVILPNNGNIIMAANQAAGLAGKPVAVAPSKFITQGIEAMMDFDPERSAEENAAAMTEAFQAVKNAQITYAVRDSGADGQDIHAGDILGILDGKISVVEPTVREAALALLPLMLDEDTSLITLLYGEDVAEADAAALADEIAALYPEHELELHLGGQAVYYYLIAVE